MQTSAGVVTVDATQPGITIPDVTVPTGLQRGWSGFLGAPNHGGVMVTLTSANPVVFLLSPDANTESGAGIGPALAVRAGAPVPLIVAETSGTPAVAVLMDQTQTAGVLNVQIPIGQANSPTTVVAGGTSLDPLTVGQTIVNVTAPGYISTGQATVVVDVNP